MKIKSIVFGLSMMMVTFSSLAVDGYKNVKFGTPLKTLQDAGWCSWKKYNDTNIKGMDSYTCSNFKFSGADTLAMAFFLNGKFQRLAISVNNGIDALSSSLVKKYGEPSSRFTQSEIESVQSNGGTISVKFDNDTVILAVSRDVKNNSELTQLIYSSVDYDTILKQVQIKNMENDL
ncbi:hypothetical protein [Buttiauxella noackiae]|uniref:hypothetical protein n=1 Tax=Buttiauxella noackiae TaxID=82992 RepID=UPI0028D798F7|nr:hypothetical protein [Buttiauxella noackiae]